MLVLSRSSKNSRFTLCFGRHKNSKNLEGENMRIVDVLGDLDDDEISGSKRKGPDFDSSCLALSASSSSRSLISRWFPKSYSFKIIKKKKKKEMDSGAGADANPCVVDPPASSGEVAVAPPLDLEAPRSSELSLDSGRKHEDFSFNIGMGAGLVFLLAKSTTEFNKMIQLRAEMEMLLKEIKHEVQRKDAIASFSESNNNISFSPCHCCSNVNTSKTTSMPNCSAFFALQEAKCSIESDRQSKYATAFANMRCISINQMEAELEVELDRLQHNLEGEVSSMLQHRVEVDSESNDPFFESFSFNCEEEINLPKDKNHECHGVSAHELERKLHELLEMRQQEKIAKLESALECAQRKLLEKEMELQLSKEIKWVASQNMCI